MRCIGCGCTTQRACRGGCSWASANPPKCSACIASGILTLSDDLIHAVARTFPRAGQTDLALQSTGRRMVCE
jgi:hypothetical protein